MINRIILMSAFAVSVICAQGRGPAPTPADMVQHRVDMLTEQLSLTPAQQEQAKTVYMNATTAETSLRDSMRTARQALNDAVKANNPAGISAAAVTIGNLTAQSTELNAKADATLYQTLNADQRANFRMQGPGMGGPGGPGGPGAGFGRGNSPRNRPAQQND